MTTNILACPGDSVGSHACEYVCAFAQEVQDMWKAALEAGGTSQADVAIAESICECVTRLALIAAGVLVVWKALSIIRESQEQCRQRQWEREDRAREVRTSLCERLLDIQKDLTRTHDNDGNDKHFDQKDGNYKHFDQKECLRYELLLCQMIQGMQGKQAGLHEMEPIDTDGLKTILKTETEQASPTS